jgi:hypothetical protein
MLKIHGGGNTFIKLYDLDSDGYFAIRKNTNGDWHVETEQGDLTNDPPYSGIIFKCPPSELKKIAEWILEHVTDEKIGHK